LIQDHLSIPFINKPSVFNYIELLQVIYSNRNKFHVSICLRHSLRGFLSRFIDYILFRVFLNAKAGIGFWNGSELSHLKFSNSDTFPMIQEYKRLVHILGSEGFDINYNHLNTSFNQFIQDRVKKIDVNLNYLDLGKRFIIICPFARDQKKKWSIENYIELSKILIDNGLTIYIIGGRDEKEAGEEMIKLIGNNAINLCGQLTLVESAKLFEKCSLYIGNDTGPMHIAGLLNRPTVALFSKHSNPGKFSPMGNNNFIIRNEGDSINNISIPNVLKGVDKIFNINYE